MFDRPTGTRRVYQVDPVAVAALREYFDSFWGHALASFRAAAEDQPPERTQDDPTDDTAVRHTITVAAPQERAFAVFTDGLDRWWPRSHKIGPSELAEAVLEGREGGRWYERDADGSECEWGKVLVWQPPSPGAGLADKRRMGL